MMMIIYLFSCKNTTKSQVNKMKTANSTSNKKKQNSLNANILKNLFLS